MAKKVMLGAFVASAPGRVTVLVSLAYACLALCCGLCPGHLLSLLLKLAIVAYAIGNCHIIGWTGVVLFAMYCAADACELMHVCRELHATESSANAPTYGQARAQMHSA